MGVQEMVVVSCFEFLTPPTLGGHNFLIFNLFVTIFSALYVPRGGAQPLVEICDFATNEFVTSCDYLTFTTTVGYIYNYYLHLKPLATTL